MTLPARKQRVHLRSGGFHAPRPLCGTAKWIFVTRDRRAVTCQRCCALMEASEVES